MNKWAAVAAAVALTVAIGNPVFANPTSVESQALAAASANAGESGANSLTIPGQILRTGINLNEAHISPNSEQLADLLKLTPVLQRLESLRGQVTDAVTLENLSNRQSLFEAQLQAQQIIHEAELSTDYTVAEINAEQQVYNELLSTWQNRANKLVQYSNWGSYYSNGALWAVAEALDIPSWKRPKYSISSGTTGIIAGIVPSIFSLYAMHISGGKKYPGEGAPNMLAKLFNLRTNNEVEYPEPVWQFLNAVPPKDEKSKTRKDQLIDRWIADSNIPNFNNREATPQLEALAGVTTEKKALDIGIMQTRLVMLSQLSAEILKMKRMLLELSMVVHGEKHI